VRQGTPERLCDILLRMERLVWTPAEVVDVDGPRAMLRAYLEQRDVRELCASVGPGVRFASACDVGCGYARLTPVLTEFADRVAGFEREEGLLRIARSLQPSIDFRRIETLRCLPVDDASFNLGLVFTVLQHVPEPEVQAVIDELRRIVRPDGYLLLCEETDSTLEAGDRQRADLGYTCGRPVTTYETWLSPWTLVATRRRSIEPDYPRPDVGTYMLFAGPSASQTDTARSG
jgi:SAM-dependent methyltransferase